jgi:hypothetical protein
MKSFEQGPDEGDATPMPVQAPAPPPTMAAVNPVVRLLLRSKLHVVLSQTLLLLIYTGRTSGKRYTIPVTYSRAGDVVTVFTHHSWWKNVRGGAPVVVEIKRRRFEGIAEAISNDRPVIAAALGAHLRELPSMARFYHVPLDANGQPDPDAVWQAARFVVLVRIQLAPAKESPAIEVAPPRKAHA